jgi:cytochrome c2
VAPEAAALAPLEETSRGEADAALVAAGKEALAHFECNRCHEGAGMEPAPAARQCVGCHQEIEAGTYEAKPELIAQWREKIVHLKNVPSLEATDARFRRGWLEGFLREPHDVRPNIGAQMPRLEVSEEQAAAIAAYLVPHDWEEAPLEGGDKKRGKQILDQMGCGTCHAFGTKQIAQAPIPVATTPEEVARGKALAPDLRHTRARFRPRALVRWLEDPKAVKPDTAMPGIKLTPQQARDVAAYLLEEDLGPAPTYAVPARLPVLERRVRYAEVEEKVFKKVCWHCHQEPALVGGDGGPGNTGGFGFAGKSLSLSSYVAVNSGMRDAAGKRMSVFKKRADGTPHIVASMHARWSEVAGRPVEGIRGMPLGLPPMTLEEIQLVETWVAQGRPR